MKPSKSLGQCYTTDERIKLVLGIIFPFFKTFLSGPAKAGFLLIQTFLFQIKKFLFHKMKGLF